MPVRRHRRIEFAAIATVGYVVAGLLLVYPGIFFAFGLQALGVAAGWWIGDPNSNDGEEFFATAVGVISYVVVLGGVAAILSAIGRRYALSALPAALVGTGVILVALAVLCVATIVRA